MVTEKSLANLKLGPFARKNRPIVHGHARRGYKSRTYTSWLGILTRVDNVKDKRYKDYGGRGITVCDEWRDFSNVLFDMGERPERKSIDRIDNDGDYCYTNCQWSTPKEQSRNTRKTVYLEYNGELKTFQAGITLYCSIE